MQQLTVGELLDSIPNALNTTIPLLPEATRRRLIAMPPEMICDPVNLLFKIRLADGSYLNIHVASK